MKIRLMVKGESLGLGDEIGLFEWKGSTCIIGRRDCEMTLTDAYCSHRHALLYQGVRGELRLRDLESTNGTFVGGQRVADTEVRVGEEIRIGKTLFHILSFRPDRYSGSLDAAIRANQRPAGASDHTNITKTRQWTGTHQRPPKVPSTGSPFQRIRKATVG